MFLFSYRFFFYQVTHLTAEGCCQNIAGSEGYWGWDKQFAIIVINCFSSTHLLILHSPPPLPLLPLPPLQLLRNYYHYTHRHHHLHHYCFRPHRLHHHRSRRHLHCHHCHRSSPIHRNQDSIRHDLRSLVNRSHVPSPSQKGKGREWNAGRQRTVGDGKGTEWESVKERKCVKRRVAEEFLENIKEGDDREMDEGKRKKGDFVEQS